MNNMTFFDSYLLSKNNSVESKNLLLTCALNTNVYNTCLKPLDLIIIKQMLDSNINMDGNLYATYVNSCWLSTNTGYILLMLIHIYVMYMLFNTRFAIARI